MNSSYSYRQAGLSTIMTSNCAAHFTWRNVQPGTATSHHKRQPSGNSGW